MMYRVVKFNIHSAHTLKGVKGLKSEECSRLHGHSYLIEIGIEIKEEFLDFKEIKDKIWNNVLVKYDHTLLSEEINTVEKLAKRLKGEINKIFSDRKMFIRIYETPTVGVEIYDEE
jgi:6-pyruvoyl-tetrahydropterin synthase